MQRVGGMQGWELCKCLLGLIEKSNDGWVQEVRDSIGDVLLENLQKKYAGVPYDLLCEVLGFVALGFVRQDGAEQVEMGEWVTNVANMQLVDGGKKYDADVRAVEVSMKSAASVHHAEGDVMDTDEPELGIVCEMKRPNRAKIGSDSSRDVQITSSTISAEGRDASSAYRIIHASCVFDVVGKCSDAISRALSVLVEGFGQVREMMERTVVEDTSNALHESVQGHLHSDAPLVAAVKKSKSRERTAASKGGSLRKEVRNQCAARFPGRSDQRESDFVRAGAVCDIKLHRLHPCLVYLKHAFVELWEAVDERLGGRLDVFAKEIHTNFEKESADIAKDFRRDGERSGKDLRRCTDPEALQVW